MKNLSPITLIGSGGAGQVLKQTTADGPVSVAALTAEELGSGTPTSLTYLRGDGQWSDLMIYIQTTQPTAMGQYLWIDTSGGNLNFWVNT